MKTHFAGLWRNPDFMKLWFGQTVSEFGSRITRDVVPLIAVIVLAATPAQMGILTVAGSIPILLFSLFAGVWVDRVRRRPVMIAADVLRLLVLTSIPLAALSGHLSMALLYVVTALVVLLTMIFEIAYRALLPTLIERKDLVEGNSKLAVTDSLAEIGGPAIAGVLVQAVGAPIAIVFDAISFVFSSLSLLWIRRPEPAPVSTPEGRDTLREMIAGWRFIMQEPMLRALLVGMGIRVFFGSFFGVLYSLYAIRYLGLSPAQLGLVIGSGGIGALLGSLLAGFVARRVGLGRVLSLSLMLGGGINLIIPLAGGPPLLAMMMLIAGQIVGDAVWSVYTINEISLRQSLVPDHLLGRVNASVGFVAEGIAPIGALIGGTLATAIGTRETLFIACAGIFIGTLWVVFSPVRHLQSYAAITTSSL
ncbi:MAG: MFS transporter [Anaerolineae bacterium]|nr:MFS transporter [Anaerolineae bacterium]